MSRISRYSPELRERAVRMVNDNRADYPSEWAAFTPISKLFGISPETLRTWVRRAAVDTGARPGITSDERARLKELERENKDLRRASDLVDRQSVAPVPNRLWVADLTYVKTHIGWVYVAFIIDVFSRFIVGWQISTSLRSDLAIDALEMAIYSRNGNDLSNLVHHSDRGVQYLSIRYSERLNEAQIVASVGSKGDSCDNALEESFNGLYKTELIHRQGPWRNVDEQKAVNLARTGAGLVSHFAGMKAASTDHLPPQIKDIAENLKTQYDMAHHAQEKRSHLGMIDDEYVRWMAICGTPSLCIDKLSVLLDMGLQHIYLLGGWPYEGPPGKRITGIVDVAELFATDVMPQIRKDYGVS